jgi:hypothetical protein
MEPKFERAVAKWISLHYYDSKHKPLNPDFVTEVEFDSFQGGYCETCSYNSVGITFKYRGVRRTEELDYQDRPLGTIVGEIVALLVDDPT